MVVKKKAVKKASMRTARGKGAPRKRAPRKAGPRKAAARTAAAGGTAPRMRLHQVSARKRATVFRDLHKVLATHGVSGTISQLHLAAATAPQDGGGAVGECPPNQIKKVVCQRNSAGEMECDERCMPV